MRERINISLPRAEYLAVCALAQRGGFANPCRFVRALLLDVVQYAAGQELAAEARTRAPTPLTKEIADMFSSLESLETPERNELTTIVEIKGRKRH